MKIYLYIRVSTDKQADEGTSLHDQERRLRGYVMAQGWDEENVLVVKDEGVSAGIALTERPNGGKMISEAKEGDKIVALKLDRMFRNVRDSLEIVDGLKDRGISLFLLDMGGDVSCGDALARAFFIIVSAFAELEKNKINERTEAGRQAIKEKGGWVGGPVPWWGILETREDDKKYLVINPEARPAVEYTMTEIQKGTSWRKIAKGLKQEFDLEIDHAQLFRSKDRLVEHMSKDND